MLGLIASAGVLLALVFLPRVKARTRAAIQHVVTIVCGSNVDLDAYHGLPSVGIVHPGHHVIPPRRTGLLSPDAN